jgi:hypothetical protein
MRLKNAFPRHPEGKANRQLAKSASFFPRLSTISGEMVGSSTTCWEYYSDEVGKILNFGEIFLGANVPGPKHRSGSGILIVE